MVAISQHQRARAAGLRVLATIHHGLDLRRYTPAARKGRYLLFLGRFSEKKGAEYAIAAARRLGLPLLLAAPPAPGNAYFETVIRPQLGGSIIYLGEVGGAEKSRLLAEALCLLMPVQWDEPFGLTAIEALASGTPVVGLRRGPCRRSSRRESPATWSRPRTTCPAPSGGPSTSRHSAAALRPRPVFRSSAWSLPTAISTSGSARPRIPTLGGGPVDDSVLSLAIDPQTQAVFRRAVQVLSEPDLPYAVGGLFALYHYAGVWRLVKDLDLFLLPEKVPVAARLLRRAGFAVRLRHPEWLVEASMGARWISSSGWATGWRRWTRAGWTTASRPDWLLGLAVRYAPPEEIIWSKSFVAGRERNDAGDVLHLLLACGPTLDWHRLLARYGAEHRTLLLSYIVLFDYVYPADRAAIPAWVREQVLAAYTADLNRPWRGPKLCRGPLLDGGGPYALDIEFRGYRDARREALAARRRRGEPVAVQTTPGETLLERPGA